MYVNAHGVKAIDLIQDLNSSQVSVSARNLLLGADTAASRLVDASRTSTDGPDARWISCHLGLFAPVSCIYYICLA